MSNLLAEYSGYNQQKTPNLPMQSSKDILSVQSVQAAQSITEEKNTDDGLTVFFGIGMTINIIMIIVFVAWATKEWKRRGASEK